MTYVARIIFLLTVLVSNMPSCVPESILMMPCNLPGSPGRDCFGFPQNWAVFLLFFFFFELNKTLKHNESK